MRVCNTKSLIIWQYSSGWPWLRSMSCILSSFSLFAQISLLYKSVLWPLESNSPFCLMLFVSISPQAWLTGVIAGWSVEPCLSVPLCLATRLQYLSLCYLWCLQPVSTTRKSQRICGWLLSLPFLNMPQSNSPQHFLVNCRRIIIAEIPQQPLHFTLG